MNSLKVKQTYVRVTITTDILVTDEDDFQTVGEFINTGASEAIYGACDYGMPYIDKIKVSSKTVEKDETFEYVAPKTDDDAA